MKQTLTVKVLVVSAVALAVASGCERRTRPPAKPDAVNTGVGENVAGRGTPLPGAASPEASASPVASPEASPVASPEASPVASASPAAQTDDQKAAELHAKLDKYLNDPKEGILIKTGFIKLVDGKDAADKLTVTIDTKEMEAFFNAEKAKLIAADANTIKKYKTALIAEPGADEIVAWMKLNLEGKGAADAKEASLKTAMEKFKDELSKIKPTVEANVTSQKADLERVEAILKSIDAAIEHFKQMK